MTTSCTRPPYSADFRRQLVELVQLGRPPEELAREFERSAQAIRNCVVQAARDAGQRNDGPTRAEAEDLRRLRAERETLAKATAIRSGDGRRTQWLFEFVEINRAWPASPRCAGS